MTSTNIEMLQIVANGLGELQDDVVFVGGAVAELYADDPAASDIRKANSTVKTYLKEECQNLLKNNNLTEGIETALPYGSGEEGTDIILGLIQSIAESI